MRILSTYKAIYSQKGKHAIEYGKGGEDVIYISEEDSKPRSNKGLTKAEADRKCMMLFGMNSDDYAKRILMAWKVEQEKQIARRD
jgi:acetamidase/formamidase